MYKNKLKVICFKTCFQHYHRYEVFYEADHEFIATEFLPGLYLSDLAGSDYKIARLHLANGNLKLGTSRCNFCSDVNDNGSLGNAVLTLIKLKLQNLRNHHRW